MNEYIIVNKTLIQKRLEELEKYYSITDFEEERRLARIDELEEILSLSTPLITELEKAFDASKIISGMNQRNQFAYKYENSKDYISNLKLDI